MRRSQCAVTSRRVRRTRPSAAAVPVLDTTRRPGSAATAAVVRWFIWFSLSVGRARAVRALVLPRPPRKGRTAVGAAGYYGTRAAASGERFWGNLRPRYHSTHSAITGIRIVTWVQYPSAEAS